MPRTYRSLQGRWDVIKQIYSRWTGCLEEVCNAPLSGTIKTGYDDDDEDGYGPRNNNKPDGNKKAKDKIKRKAEASSLRDKINHMVKSNEALVIKTLDAKKELAEKKAQEKQEKWQLLKEETVHKVAIEERRDMAKERKAMAKLLQEENKIMMMN
ncbi:Lactation elevated protein 1 [Hordeum vulgare]|nr:Lactation elevated protein 1 [Hordeum vulgare]